MNDPQKKPRNEKSTPENGVSAMKLSKKVESPSDQKGEVVSVLERVKKLPLLMELVNKRELTQAKMDMIETFSMGHDDFAFSVTLNALGKDPIDIKQPDVCEEIILLLKGKVEMSLQKTDVQIEAFVI